MNSGNCFCFFSFFDAIRKEPGGLFFISVGQLQQRPIDERKVGFKKGRENQNILSSFLLQIKKKNLLKKNSEVYFGAGKMQIALCLSIHCFQGGNMMRWSKQLNRLSTQQTWAVMPVLLFVNSVASVCTAFNSSRQQLLIKLDECSSLCFSILKFHQCKDQVKIMSKCAKMNLDV